MPFGVLALGHVTKYVTFRPSLVWPADEEGGEQKGLAQRLGVMACLTLYARVFVRGNISHHRSWFATHWSEHLL